jgi:hypothetical protein
LVNETFFDKEFFTIKDFALLVNKETNTIRSWENKNIVKKPGKGSNNWRQYTKTELADCLEAVLLYNWERKVIKNRLELKHAIKRLRGDFIPIKYDFD